MPLRRRRLLLAALAAPAVAQAQPGFPDKPLRLVVPFAPAGLTDIPARLLAGHMSRTLGQPVAVENRAGAAGTIGAEVVRAAPADGYTLLQANAASSAQAPALRRNVGYNPVEDFAAIMQAVISPFALVVRPDRGLATWADFLALARREGRVTFGTTGPGGTGHILALLLSKATGLTFEPIHFPGDAPAIQEVLATTGARRWSVFPNAPTLLELGYRDTDLVGWNGLVAPKGTPPAIIARLNAAAQLAIADPEVRARLDVVGLEPVGGTAAQFSAFIAREFSRYRRIGEEFNLMMD